uniref:BACK domain-containing protein n=1 Tax=Rhabditophanes sp. KR3021 TaxID=114890 RepID=A0AC35UGE0_9BILA
MHASNDFFQNKFIENPDTVEVECKDLTISDMELYIEYIYGQKTFNFFKDTTILRMINVYEAMNDESLLDSIINYSKISGKKMIKMFAYTRENSFEDLYDFFKNNIACCFEAYARKDDFDSADFTTLLDIFNDELVSKNPQETILKCYISWILHKFDERQQYCLELLRRINFRFIDFGKIKKIFDQNKKLSEIDGVSLFIYETLYKRGLFIQPNSKPTDILLTCMDEDENGKIFNYNINSQLFSELASLSEQIFLFDYEDAVGNEIVGEHLLIICQARNFNLLKFNFMTRQILPLKLPGFYDHSQFSTCTINKEVLMFTKTEVKSLDQNKMEWISHHSKIPTELKDHKSVRQDNSVYIVGRDISSTLRFDPREGKFETCSSTLFQGFYSGVCTINDSIMKAGGSFELLDDDGDFEDFVAHGHCEMFDVRTNRWREVAALPTIVREPECCQIENTVKVFDGLNNTYSFDKSTEIWSSNETDILPNFEVCWLNLI